MTVPIRPLGEAEATRRLDELAAILADAVAGGASVNFMAGFGTDEARAFWRGQIAGIAGGERMLLVADDGSRLLGTAVVTPAPQPNGVHRAEIGKMLVLRAARRQGLGRRLLEAAEAEALKLGRTLLLLDTETGSAGDALYRAAGWTAYGTVPDHAFRPEGRLAPTTMFFKAIGPHTLRG